MKAQFFKNQFKMPILLEQVDVAAQTITSNIPIEVFFTCLDLKHAFRRLQLSKIVSNCCNCNIGWGDATGIYRFKTDFCGLSDLTKEFQKAIDNTQTTSLWSFILRRFFNCYQRVTIRPQSNSF